jgi:lipopolysaccharide transport system ATP-binding protein
MSSDSMVQVPPDRAAAITSEQAGAGPTIEVRNVSKSYLIYRRPEDRLKQALWPRLQRLAGRRPKAYCREFWALKDVSFDVHKGETVGVIGRNGSGKSTLLQLVCGILAPSEGGIAVQGRVAALLELGAGFNGEFTGRENVYMNGSILGLDRDQIDERFASIAAFADIGDFIDQPVKHYSSGMYVRLAFAVVAHVDADILIIDEALAVGDAFFVQKCMRFLRKFKEHGTLLFVSHDASAVLNLCSKAIWLDHGRIRLSGEPKEVTEQYFAARYECEQGASAVTPMVLPAHAPLPGVDMRLAFINVSPYRNDIELFRFNPNSASFGKGGALITSVSLIDDRGAPYSWVVGGERVTLKIQAIAKCTLTAPIIGFYVNDRLGQNLFGDNTFVTYRTSPVSVSPGEVLDTSFVFRMPLLPIGDYTVCAAIADGTQATHTQHHWIHDALAFKSHSTSVASGLVGVPMLQIDMRKAR